ncbi:hypothetical protein KUIN1_00690 [Pseudomonas sp. KUIN-1]|nr:hypothetical protein KUIN1_00690 [Pseudomonas sp. KUIN-1]
MPMLRVGMQVVTLCVTYPWRYARSGQDAERQEAHSHAEHGNDENLEISIVPMLRVIRG